MIPSSRQSSYPRHRIFAAAAAPGQNQVAISPSRAEIRRADPSLSFQVIAPGAVGFDVIVSTDPALFDPSSAHRRTPKNFRSSRQDFGGEPIEIETGFYLLPRAFLRDLVSVDPKPTKLYYIAVAYDDTAARQARYSLAPEAMATRAPSVGIAADLAAANLSRMLGVAVDRLGAVNARGRVMAVSTDPRATPLPDAIGGLPLDRRVRLQTPPDALPDVPMPPSPAPAQGGGAAFAPQYVPARTDPSPIGSYPRPMPTPPRNPDLPPATVAGRGFSTGHRFVDEDYAYGAPGGAPVASGYRDLDAGFVASSLAYDDGFGATASEPPAARATPIPPMDPVPGPADAVPPAGGSAARPDVGPGTARTLPPAAGDASAEDLLLQAILAEGAAGRYEALSLDGGFRGRFGPYDPYYRRAHDGLRLGPHQAIQDSGELGELLALMHAADPAGFAQTFGADAQTLLDVTNAEGPSGLELAGGRGPRVQPVAGADLWEEPWVDRFRMAAKAPAFQAAMRGQILARRLDPLRPLLAACGIDSARGMAMLLAAAILVGVDGATRLLRAAVNPFDTPARLGAALDALGFADLGSFRVAHQLPPGDTIDDATHIALIAALRQLGADSPVQVPDAEAIMDALVTTAGPGPLGDALLRIRVSNTFASPGAGG